MMIVSTDVSLLDASSADDSGVRRQGEAWRARSVMQRVNRTTAVWDPSLSNDTLLPGSGAPQRRFASPITNVALLREVSADSTPLQIWEGTVLEVDRTASIMQVLLDAKVGQMPRHTGEIELEWVADQDQDLVRPGAVFYLTLFKRTRRGSIENSQELRFRRRPSWSEVQLRQIEEDAAMLLSKMNTPSTAGDD